MSDFVELLVAPIVGATSDAEVNERVRRAEFVASHTMRAELRDGQPGAGARYQRCVCMIERAIARRAQIAGRQIAARLLDALDPLAPWDSSITARELRAESRLVRLAVDGSTAEEKAEATRLHATLAALAEERSHLEIARARTLTILEAGT